MAKDIEPKLKLISEYLKLADDEIFEIPEYQRAYSWTITQCDKLWQDVEAFINASSKDPYFFGTVIIDCSTDGKFSLIDGQQRTTTFLLLLKALQLRLQLIIKNFLSDPESAPLKASLSAKLDKIIDILYKADEDLRFEIYQKWDTVKGICVLNNKSINEQYKKELQTILEAKDYDAAEREVYKIPKKQKDNKYTNFFRNFKFFYEKLKEYSDSSRLNVFAKTFLEKCQIIEIRSWQIEQAITMFNSLNSTGMPLSDADIISAQLYSNAGENKNDFNEQWERVNKLASELSERRIIDIDSVLQQYMYIVRAQRKEYIKDGTQPDVTTPGLRSYYTNLNKDLLKKPFELCNSFEKIAKIWDFIKNYPSIKLLLKFNENAKLYLISYLYRFDVNDISESKILPITESLIRLFALLELVDAGYSSSNFKTFLFGENIKFVDTNVSEQEIEKDFNEHINRRWKREDIIQAISDYDKNILVFLNEYLYAKEKKLPFDFSDTVNIEHIMPASGHDLDAIRIDANIASKDEFDSIVNKLGNKILLEENINKSIGKSWFVTKKNKSINDKAGYKDSKYNLALKLSDYPGDLWTKKDIENANKKVCSRMIKFIFGAE